MNFTSGHNNLLRHRCKLAERSDVCRLCGGACREDVLHLWAECSAIRDLGGLNSRGTIFGLHISSVEFLREPLIAELLDQDGPTLVN